MNENVVKASVILPCFNAGQVIAEAIGSVLNQTYTDYELIVINDGSTDNSAEVIKGFSDIRIRYIENDGNKGLIYTLNRGIEEAQGEYIIRMDADDISMPTRCERQIEFMDAHPEVLASGCQVEFFGNSFKKIGYLPPIEFEDIRVAALLYNPVYHPTAIIRARVFQDFGIRYKYDYIHAEDYKLWSDILHIEGAKIVNLPDKLLRYRISPSQVSKKYADIQKKTAQTIRRENVNYFLFNYGLELPEVMAGKFISQFTQIYGRNMPERNLLLCMFYMSVPNPWKRVFLFVFSKNLIDMSISNPKYAITIILSLFIPKRWSGYML